MPLVLNMYRGDDFFVEDNRVKVIAVFDDAHFIVETEDGQQFDVRDDRAVEVLPNVMLSAGNKQNQHLASVVIDAPREMTILRGHTYRAAKDAKADAALP